MKSRSRARLRILPPADWAGNEPPSAPWRKFFDTLRRFFSLRAEQNGLFSFGQGGLSSSGIRLADAAERSARAGEKERRMEKTTMMWRVCRRAALGLACLMFAGEAQATELFRAVPLPDDGRGSTARSVNGGIIIFPNIRHVVGSKTNAGGMS